jgi:hypothetical protein
MELSSVEYWKAFAARGEVIEEEVEPLKMMSIRPKESGWKSGTTATFALYIGTALFWLFSLGSGLAHTTHSKALRIVVAGDGRAEYSGRPEDADGINKVVTQEMVQAVLAEKAEILLWTGDLTNVQKPEAFESQLRSWVKIMQPLYNYGVTVLPVRGNHEFVWYDPKDASDKPKPIPNAKETWNRVFSGDYALPQNGPDNEKNLSFYYTRDSVLAIGLDDYEGGEHTVNQAWLDDVLRKEKKPFVFVYGHEPAFMAGRHPTEETLAFNPTGRDLMWKSLIDAGARVYFCGHDHFYDHMAVSKNGESDQEVHQILAGTAGAPFYKGGPYEGNNSDWKLTPMRHIDYAYGYVLIVIEGNSAKITFKGKVSPGKYRIMDSFDYTVANR